MSEQQGVDYDAIIIGGGPAGLSAALNLVRAKHHVLIIDTGRPRNAATLVAHGFITRDGIAPHELRSLASQEIEQYADAEIAQRATVTSVRHDRATEGFEIDIADYAQTRTVTARALVIATGLRETLPAFPSIRAYYGMSLFSCVACDGYEHSGKPLALFGETPDLATRALLVSRWSPKLTVFTNGAPVIDHGDALTLAERGIHLERRIIDDLEGARGAVSAVRMVDGDRIDIAGGFVRPHWTPALDPFSVLDLETDDDGLLVTDRDGRTSVSHVYAAGDVAAPGPQQLIVAAGAGARVAAVLTHDRLGIRTSH